MALGPRSSSSAALIGAVAMLVILILAGAAIVLGGAFPISASSRDGATLSGLVHATMEHSVKRNAKGLAPPPVTRADIVIGAAHYKGMCQQCHGGPDAPREEFAEGLNPQPPDLAKGEATEWNRAQIFWIAKHGIKMTAMPAFGKNHSDDDLWRIAAFVVRLRTMGATEYAGYPVEEQEGEEGASETPQHHHHAH